MTQVNKTGHYQTRDGRVAYVNAVSRTHAKGFIYGQYRSWETWNPWGQVDQMSESPRDLIGAQE